MEIIIRRNSVINIVPSWDYILTIRFESLTDYETIDEIYFVCADLGICKQMIPETLIVGDITYYCFYCKVPYTETINFENPLTTKYNLNAIFVDGSIHGGYCGGELNVIDNKNICFSTT